MADDAELLTLLQDGPVPLNDIVQRLGKDALTRLKPLQQAGRIVVMKHADQGVMCSLAADTPAETEESSDGEDDHDDSSAAREAEVEETKTSIVGQPPVGYEALLEKLTPEHGLLWTPLTSEMAHAELLSELKVRDLAYTKHDQWYLAPTLALWRLNLQAVKGGAAKADQVYPQMLLDFLFALYINPRWKPDLNGEEATYLNTGALSEETIPPQREIHGITVTTVSAAVERVYAYKKITTRVIDRRLREAREGCDTGQAAAQKSVLDVTRLLIQFLEKNPDLSQTYEKHTAAIRKLLGTINQHIKTLSELAAKRSEIEQSVQQRVSSRDLSAEDRQGEKAVFNGYTQTAGMIFEQTKQLNRVVHFLFKFILAPFTSLPPNKRTDDAEKARIAIEKTRNLALQLIGRIDRSISLVKSSGNTLGTALAQYTNDLRDRTAEEEEHRRRVQEGKIDTQTRDTIIGFVDTLVEPLIANYSSFRWRYGRVKMRTLQRVRPDWDALTKAIDTFAVQESTVVKKVAELNCREIDPYHKIEPVPVYFLPVEFSSYTGLNDAVLLSARLDRSLENALHQAVVFCDEELRAALIDTIGGARDTAQQNVQIFQIYQNLYKRYITSQTPVVVPDEAEFPPDFKNKALFDWFNSHFPLVTGEKTPPQS